MFMFVRTSVKLLLNIYRYHMYGSGIGTLTVEIVVKSNITAKWSRSGNQGKAWKESQIQLNYQPLPFTVRA